MSSSEMDIDNNNNNTSTETKLEPGNVSFEYMLITLVLPFGKSNAVIMSKCMRVCKMWNKETRKYCKENRFDASGHFDRPLISSSRRGNLGAVKLLLECSNANTAARHGESILMAYINGHQEIFDLLSVHYNPNFGDGGNKLIACMIVRSDWVRIEQYFEQFKKHMDAEQQYFMNLSKEYVEKQRVTLDKEQLDALENKLKFDMHLVDIIENRLNSLYYAIAHTFNVLDFRHYFEKDRLYRKSSILRIIDNIYVHYGIQRNPRIKTSEHSTNQAQNEMILSNIKERMTMDITVKGIPTMHYLDGMIIGIKSGFLQFLRNEDLPSYFANVCKSMDEDAIMRLFDEIRSNFSFGSTLKLLERVCELQMFDVIEHMIPVLKNYNATRVYKIIHECLLQKNTRWFFILGIQLDPIGKMCVLSEYYTLSKSKDGINDDYLIEIIDSFDQPCWEKFGYNMVNFSDLWECKNKLYLQRVWEKVIVNVPDLETLYCFVIPHFVDFSEESKTTIAIFIVKKMLEKRRTVFLDLCNKRIFIRHLCLTLSNKGSDYGSVFANIGEKMRWDGLVNHRDFLKDNTSIDLLEHREFWQKFSNERMFYVDRIDP